MDGFSQGPVGRAVNAVKNSGVGAHVFSVRLSGGRLRSRAHIPQIFAIYQAFAFLLSLSYCFSLRPDAELGMSKRQHITSLEILKVWVYRDCSLLMLLVCTHVGLFV